MEVVAKEHRQKGEKVTALPLDLENEASVLALRDTLLERAGTIDVLVNSAVLRVTDSWDDPLTDFDRSWRVNASGLHAITRTFGEVMIENRCGTILNIGSMMGVLGIEHHNYDGTEMNPGWSPEYFFYKGGMVNYTRFCASYFGRYGVRCNCINPGGLASPDHPERFVKNYSARTQLGRLANDSDLKGAIVFLASEASAYVTGAIIPVDGGYTAK